MSKNLSIAFTPDAHQDYINWVKEDKNIFKKINELIKDIMRSPYEGIGKPEPLKHDLSECYSRRITKEHRLVYRVSEEYIVILSCRGHYT